jgi:hypothetical protein
VLGHLADHHVPVVQQRGEPGQAALPPDQSEHERRDLADVGVLVAEQAHHLLVVPPRSDEGDDPLRVLRPQQRLEQGQKFGGINRGRHTHA